MPSGAIEVDGFLVRCLVKKTSPDKELVKRGIFEVELHGIDNDKKVLVAEWDGRYFRRKGISKIKS